MKHIELEINEKCGDNISTEQAIKIVMAEIRRLRQENAALKIRLEMEGIHQ